MNSENKKDYVDVAYDEKMLPFTPYPKKLVNYLVEHFSIKENDSLLELGCGRGEFLKEFLSLNIKTRGIDQSDYAKKLNPENKPTNSQSFISLSLNPFHKYKIVSDQKGIKQTFTLNSGEVKL